MKRLRPFLARPIVRAACLVLPVVALAALLVTANLSRIMAHSSATMIAASEAATIVKSGQARSIEVQADRAYLTTVEGEYVFIKDREPRAYRAISRTSANPRVATSATRPSRRWSSAFVATVVPCARTCGSRSRQASSTAREVSAGVDGTFVVRPSSATTSVNVPPVSTPNRPDRAIRGN